jgi:TetR/AcrR family transcriptional repressor of nem operon
MARPPGYDRDVVLHTVERQFRKTGYAGTSLDDISAVTGLGRGSLYGAFGDKHDLFLLVLDAYCFRTAAKVAEMLAGPDDEALDRLKEFIMFSARTVIEDDDSLGCMAGRFAIELGPSVDTEATSRINRVFKQLKATLMSCVKAAQRHGDLDPDVPPEDVACLILTLSRGFDVVARAGVSPHDLDAAARNAVALLPVKKSRAGRRAKAPAN